MLEKNRMVNVNRGKKKNVEGNYTRVDPHAEMASWLITQAITDVEGYNHEAPMTSDAQVVRAKNWVDQNQL